MKKVATLVAIILAFGFGGYALTASDYQGGIAFRATTGAQAQNVIWGITPLGRMDLIGGATFDNYTSATTLTITETNIELVGAIALTGGLSLTGDIDVQGGDITNTTVGGGLDLEATAAAANTATTFVEISGTTAAHATLTGTDIFLDITPTIGIPTGTAANVHLIDMTFSSPAWATAVTSNVRGIYFAPTIGNATLGTNTVALFDVAAIAGDAQVSLYGIRFGALTGTAATEYAFSVGAGWDRAIDLASPFVSTSTLSAEDLVSTDDADVNDALVCGDLTIDEAVGTLVFSSATSATISTSTAGVGLVLDALDAAADSDMTYVSITGSTPIHTAATHSNVFFDITPTFAINTGATNSHLIDLTFATPAWATAVASNTRAIYIAPTIGNATLGTNAVNLIEVAAIAGDDLVTLNAIKIGALTGTGATEYALSIGAGWDRAVDLASPFVTTSTISAEDLVSTDDADINDTLTVGDIIIDEAVGTLVFSAGTSAAISTNTAGVGLALDALDAAAGSDMSYVTVSGSTPAHATNTPTSIFLDINPTVAVPTVANTVNLIDMTFATPVYGTAVSSDYRGIYFAPTIGAATLGTNQVNMIEIANYTGDAQVNVTGIEIGTSDGLGTAYGVSIGAGWDQGITSASPVALTGADADLDVEDSITAGDVTIDEAAGALVFSGATSGTISTSTSTAGLVLDAADAAAGSDKTYVEIAGSVPVHAANTPTSIFLDISPTVGIPTVANTVNLIDLTFTTPIYATAVASTYRGLYFAPTIGAATLGTNVVALIDVAAITGDDTVSLYGIRAGALTGTAATEDFISIGAGWDHGVNSESTVKAASFVVDDGDADVTVDSDNQTNAAAAINIPDFVDATADFLVTNTFTTVFPFHGGLAGEDTDAVGTNGGGFVGAGAIDVTTYDYNDGAAGANDVLCKVYDFGTTTWDDLKTSALLTAGADWAINYQLLPDADAEEAGDAFAVGFDEKFCAFAFNDLATNNGALATWAANGAKWQYSTGAGTWSDLTVYDGTDATAQNGLRPLQRTGEITFVPPSDWVVATYDGEEAYWVQCVITAAQLTQTPVIDDTNKDEPIVPFPTDGLPAPFKMEITKVRVANMHTTVHDQAIVFIVGNFTDGDFTAAQTWTASQPCDTFTLASALAFDPGDVIAIMCTNDTASTNNPVWAVEFTATYED